MTADNSDYKSYNDDSDFSLFWPHTDDAFPEDIVTIPGEESEWLDVNKLDPDVEIIITKADTYIDNKHPFIHFYPDLNKVPLKPLEIHQVPDLKNFEFSH